MDRYPYLGTLYYLTSVYLRGIGTLFIFFCIIFYTHSLNAYHLTIEREIEDARSTRDAGVSSKIKESRSSSSSGKKQRASSSRGIQGNDHPGKGQIRVSGMAG